MLLKYWFWVIVLSFLNLKCTSTQISTPSSNVLPASVLQPYGRFSLNKDQNLELISSAVHFGFSFEGRECQIYTALPQAGSHNYLQYELDGVYQKKIRIDGQQAAPLTITAPAAGRHTVWVYKATEAHTGAIIIQKITGNSLKVIPKPAAPLIEFIGNSITCGAAADPAEMPCGTGAYHDQHNAYAAYGPRVARALQASFILSSVSGIGIYRNWNSTGPTMPQVYEKIDFQANNAQQWNFAGYSPRVVSIALGTNDFSGGDGKKERLPFDSTAFVINYIKFVQLVKNKYPRAQVALLSSPMIGGKNRQTLQNCLTAVKSRVDASYPNGKPVALHFFQPMQARGCSGHPNVEDHGRLAAELVPFFRKLL